jgi:hypothetical protein
MVEEYIEDGFENLYLAGVECNNNGKGDYFNFIMNDGVKTDQKPDVAPMTTHMINF